MTRERTGPSKHRALVLATLLFFSAAAASFSEPGDGMEGTIWKFRPKGPLHWLMFWDRDYLVFQSGNFMEAGLAKRGFSPILYTAVKTAHGIDWTAVLRNPQNEQITWKGTRVSYWMSGTYALTRPDGSVKQVKWKAWQIYPQPPKP